MEYVDGSGGRQEAYGGSKRGAKVNLEEKIEERNNEIRYGKQKRAGDITLEDAVKDKMKEHRAIIDLVHDENDIPKLVYCTVHIQANLLA